MPSRSSSPFDGRHAGGRGARDKGAPLRVLVAEDHPVCRQMLGLILEQFGVQPTLVADGSQAVREWRRGGFDALLLDIEMPVMSGLRATEIIRSEEVGRAPTPIIIVSSDFRPERISQCLEAGADLHLAKPVTAAIVAGALASVLSEGLAAVA